MSDEQILGVVAGATVDQVKRAYRKRARLVHPDHGGDAEAFRNLRAAYERLMQSASAGEVKKACDVCNGSGRVRVAEGFFATTIGCDACGGSGDAR